MTETLTAKLQVLLTPTERAALQLLANKAQRSSSFVAREAIRAAIKKGRAA